MPPLDITAIQVKEQRENVMKAIRRRFTSLYEEQPFYADLIQEALNECFTPRGREASE